MIGSNHKEKLELTLFEIDPELLFLNPNERCPIVNYTLNCSESLTEDEKALFEAMISFNDLTKKIEVNPLVFDEDYP